jgi:antitoxin component YwqK of YwqJK toxin-antitoxin module
LSNKEEEAAETVSKTTTTLYKRAHYNDGKYVGKYEEYHNNGTLYILAEYDDEGKKDGEYFEYNRFGQCITHYRYSHDLLDGWCEKYSDEGKIQEQAFYVLNVPHGIYKQFHPNGKTKIVQTFHKGVAHGECMYYSQSGKAIGKYLYVNGKCKELGNK